MIPKLMTPLVTPITDFTLACDRLLNDPITRGTLTRDELNIIKISVQRLMEKFFSQSSPGPPSIVPTVILPHGGGEQ